MLTTIPISIAIRSRIQLPLVQQTLASKGLPVMLIQYANRHLQRSLSAAIQYLLHTASSHHT